MNQLKRTFWVATRVEAEVLADALSEDKNFWEKIIRLALDPFATHEQMGEMVDSALEGAQRSVDDAIRSERKLQQGEAIQESNQVDEHEQGIGA